ncbi:polysaccharide deacetylase family protein [Halosolutus gelatinilyticus]|uniref:polysaccharide deacetylase family protein n=1 Tax=Halosolutus gelatinilyticus TaxID=2931975 RepID=UPI001FF2FCE1|nr:polysaccharide deacetylase family protein [Halosolutus gelatinilyticus]
MERRTYLALASATCLAGCTDSRSASRDREPASETESSSAIDSNATPESDRTADDPDESATEGANPEGTDDDFEDLSAWDVSGGTLTPDPDRSFVGTQSARLETRRDEGATRLRKPFSSPRDLTDVVPGIAAAAADRLTLVVWLLDENGNRIEYRRRIDADLPFMRYNVGLTAVDDGFDHGAIVEVQVRLWTADDDARTVWLDDLHFTPRPERGKVMIQFDDGNETDYTEALPILEPYGYPAVSFVNPGSIERGSDGGPALSLDQARELRDAGWCIANHTMTHAELPELDASEQETEIREGKAWLREHGFEEGAEYFAYPFGAYDATTIELVDEHHSIGFAGGGVGQGYTTNTTLASRLGEPDAERARTAIERTAELRGISSLLFHGLEGETLADFEATIEALHEYESAGEIDVILPRDLERSYLF